MKLKIIKILFGILFFISISQFAFSQDPYLNQQKYWYMRQRLTEKFMKVGPNHGESLPAENYQIIGEEWWHTNSNINKKLIWASETTYELGYYIGVLATEIKLLRDRGEDYSNTIMELYYALNAIDRLDDYAELVIDYVPPGFQSPGCNKCALIADGLPVGNVTWDNTTQHWLPKPGSIWNATNSRNGYFIRTDAPPDFINNFPDANMWSGGITRPWSTLPAAVADCSYGDYSTHPSEITYTTNGDFQETSQDQMFSLLMGLKLVKQFVPGDVMYSGENLRTKAINIAGRLLSIYDFFYSFESPVTGNPACNGGNNSVDFTGSIFALMQDFYNDFINYDNNQFYLWGSIDHPCGDIGSYAVNRQLYAMVTAIANTTAHGELCVYVTHDGFDWGFFYLLRQALYPHGPDGGCNYDINAVVADLNCCPCRGPHLDLYEWTEDGTYKPNGVDWHAYSTFGEVRDHAPCKWHLPNRYENGCNDLSDITGTIEPWGLKPKVQTGEFSGLDYMLLHNLANIVYGDGALGSSYTSMLNYYFTGPLTVGSTYHPVGFIDMKTDVIIPATTYVDAKASESIILLPGFDAKTGSYFHAQIKSGQWTCVDDIYKDAPYYPTQTIESTNNANRNNHIEYSQTNRDSILIADLSFEVFPNPTYSSIRVHCNSSGWDEPVQIKFIDINGKELISLNGSCNQPIDISNFSQGYYNMCIEYKFNNEFKQQYFKIIKL